MGKVFGTPLAINTCIRNKVFDFDTAVKKGNATMLTTININGTNAVNLNRDADVRKTPVGDEVIIRRKDPTTDSRRDQFLSRAMNIYDRSRRIRRTASSII